MKKTFRVLAVAGAMTLLPASGASAIVGGSNAPAGAYPSVAEVTFAFGMFGCTGTLIAPQWVLTAGHCGSTTGAVGVAQPLVNWPAASFDVRIGGDRTGQGERVTVSSVNVNPDYLLGRGYDITLLKLSKPSTKTPTPVAGASHRAIWEAGDMQKIVGWGNQDPDGNPATVLQHAQVPVTTDAYCLDAYSDFDESMVCAGYPEGGIDTCQGDSGGPMFGTTTAGTLRVTGATSFGDGCAQAGSPGVYARVGDAPLREWIRSLAPNAIDG